MQSVFGSLVTVAVLDVSNAVVDVMELFRATAIPKRIPFYWVAGKVVEGLSAART